MTTTTERGDREARAASNQRLFRMIRQQLTRLGATRGALPSRAACECANDACFEEIKLTVDDYEALREAGRQFAIVPRESHLFHDRERIVERQSEYWIVEETADATLDGESESGSTIRGEMLWFNTAKDCGFISTDEGERLYVAGSDFAGGAGPEGRCAGLVVSFRVASDGQERKAENVVFMSERAPRRARSHHGARRRGS